jgi:hypothetical protein
MIFTFLLTSAAIPAAGQTPPMPPTDLSLGYQTLHIPGQNYPLGVFVGLSTRLTDVVRIVGEAGLSLNQQPSANQSGTLSFYQYGVGPRVHASGGRVVPYAQVLFGGVHSRANLTTTGNTPFNASTNGWMVQPGAGVIIPMTRTFAIQAGLNYRRVIFPGNNDNETSVVAGVRIAFR